MAEPFNPKFVDLVRNYTTTAGTGDFMLGAAVNGFTGIAAALSVGEQFHYSCVGIDKPAETEVGRGTLLAGGKIGRAPASGSLTNFSAGNKSIALVAAAEWFRSMSSVAGGVATRAALAAAETGSSAALTLHEAGRGGLFRFDGADHSARVAADPKQGIHVAPASDPSGASGAWVRQFTGPASSLWWGVSTASTAGANVAAYKAALATLKALAVTGFGYNKGSIGLHTPAGHYLFDDELAISHVVRNSGDYTGGFSGGGTVFEWTSFTNGFDILGWDGATNRGNGATLDGFYLKGPGLNAGAEGEYHAVKFTGTAHLIHLCADNWAGDGFNGYGNFGANDGNINSSTFRNIAAQGCRWALNLAGADGNACVGYNVGGIGNRRGVIFDGSFLGNAFYGGITETNSTVPGFATRCESNGHIYIVKFGEEAWCSANAPSGTTASNTGWLYFTEGVASVVQPTWSAGRTWYFGAPLCSYPTNGNMQTLFSGFYVESNENPVVMSDLSRLDPARQLVAVWNSYGKPHGGYMRAGRYEMEFNNGVILNGSLKAQGAAHHIGNEVNPGVRNTDMNYYSWSTYTFENFYTNGVFKGKRLQWNNKHHIDFDIQFFRKSDGTNIAQLDSNGFSLKSGSLGYGAGTGGTVAQATDKSTAVTLHKASGQVAVNGAAMAAGSVAEFTVTNNMVASTDTVILNLASGAADADAYRYWVGKVSAGSFKVCVENRSAGALSEDLVLNFAVVKAMAA